MANLLHIQTSPRGSRSTSQAVAEHFIDSYRNTHRGDTVETLNVWQAQFPEFDGAIIDAKYAIAHGQPHSPEQVHAWKAVARSQTILSQPTNTLCRCRCGTSAFPIS